MTADAIDPRILDEAADWLVQLNAGGATDEDRAACERWRRSGPEQARAWARAELLMNTLGRVPGGLGLRTLDRPGSGRGRRAAVAKLAVLLAAVPAGLGAWHLLDGEALTASHRTAAGEQRELVLADGTRVTLNTRSALDVSFDERERLLRLHAGDILVQTAPDTSPLRRPFRVATRDGRLEALGTRFLVRQDDARMRVAVLEGAVRIEPHRHDGDAPVLHAGQQADYDAHGVSPSAPADTAAAAWTRRMLVADRLTLGEVVAELARYRGGWLRCDPAVAGLRVSGALPLDDPDRALAMLAATHPVRVESRWSGRWITVVAR